LIAPPRRWQYVRNNNVQLPDEYDQIVCWVEESEGRPVSCRGRVRDLGSAGKRSVKGGEWENSPGTYVLECNAPNKPGCHVAKKTFDTAEDERVGLERAHEQLGLLKDIEEFLPHLRVTFSGHDGPAQMVGHEYVSSSLGSFRSLMTANYSADFLRTLIATHIRPFPPHLPMTSAASHVRSSGMT
jgi:hypothetical protein